jgi:hypothetical protein
MTRDEFLCDKMGYKVPYSNPQFFSTPDGFFKLWEWASQQEWFIVFACPGIAKDHWIQTCYINPDYFADAVSRYLGWE